jgi:formylglycine-generating enzyme required for sulfatase activity
MHGNAWEWVEDCWSDEYTAAHPADGKPFLGANCSGRVMRGGSWEDYGGDVRAAARIGNGKEEQTWSDGFRVARSLDER